MKLKTFGGLLLLRDTGPAEGAGGQRRRLALLALLDWAGERGLSRDKILGYLWPESDAERAKKILAQALYALRRDLGAEDLFLGTNEVRLNREILTSDRYQFLAAIEHDRLETAVALYEGPYLDGFYLGEAPEFERWIDTERTNLAHDYITALETLAAQAESRQDFRAAVGWWRRLAAADPLNARTALGLMGALVGAGDRAGALQHARVYEELLRQELEVAPDPEVQAFVAQLRKEPAPPPPSRPAAATPPAPAPAAPPPSPTPPDTFQHSSLGHTDEYARPRPAPERVPAPAELTAGPVIRPSTHPIASRASPPRSRARRMAIRWAQLIAVAVAAAGAGVYFTWRRNGGGSRGLPVVAVGRFVDYTRDSLGLGRPLSDMLATNLARAPGLQVVSTARMYELLAQTPDQRDSSAAVVSAARRAGATELVDGALYRVNGGQLRLDLRRTDLVTGSMRTSYSVQGKDLFALVENGTRQLTSNLGLPAPGTPLADVTTSSVLAYRLYGEGMRALYGGDATAARQLLSAALNEDSTFAMAAYYLAVSYGIDRARMVPYLEQAVRLSTHASDRERLLIKGGWADAMDDPSRLAIAETLTVRYPQEPDGYLLLGHARIWDGDFLAALDPLGRVLKMDSLGLRRDPAAQNSPPRCLVCDAFYETISAYHFADSMPAAIRVAREWTRLQPNWFNAWGALAGMLHFDNRYEEALAVSQTVAALAPHIDQTPFRMMIRQRAGDFTGTDQYYLDHARGLDSATRAWALEWLTNSLRMQGRLREAMPYAREMRQMGTPWSGLPRSAAPYEALWEAQIRFEQGDLRSAAALFDSITAAQLGETPSRKARQRAWTQTLRATSLAAAGDTTLLSSLADSVEMWGSQSGYGRDRRLHHHIRGLLLRARGRLEEAAAEFRLAIFSPSVGYTRTNLELGRTLLQLRQPAEAVALAHSALHGTIDGPNTYVTRTELFELAANAFDLAGMRDSAAANYRIVLHHWSHADPDYKNRIQAAQLRLAALTGEKVSGDR